MRGEASLIDISKWVKKPVTKQLIAVDADCLRDVEFVVADELVLCFVQ